ncbi:MAG: DUF1254 domain-containing protein, partial [Alphaproteobacteria bacterium]|nr:DUF1254 domain-containing protein [Alphaproteobacteria bacterium]
MTTTAFGLLPALSILPARAAEPSPEEVRAIAKEAYVYGFPIVDNYRIQYAYFVDGKNPEYKAPYNQLVNIPRVFTPDDKAVQTPNSDTPYSWVGLDLRAEPVVISLPKIEAERYYSVQLIDYYTFNFDYLGSRTTGNDGGHFMIAGPAWKGETPKGVTKVISCETDLALGLFRTQLFSPDDLDNVKKIQEQYQVRPLSAFLGTGSPAAAPPLSFIPPLSPEEQRSALSFFTILNAALALCGPMNASETELMARFATIGIRAGAPFDPERLSLDLRKALADGIADAWASFEAGKKRMQDGEVTSGDLLGARAHLNNNYLFRMTGAVLGIYGNSKEEAMYPVYYTDAEGQPLTGARRYTLRFPPGQLPPVNSFWSLTMYEQPQSLLVANPLNRYLLNSSMLPQFRMDADGGLTLYVQNEAPAGNEANWLPAPKGDFSVIMRLYWPKLKALDGSWQ